MIKQRNQQKHNEVFEFIKNFIKEKKHSPTIREVCDHFDWESSSTAYYYLIKLAIDGKIDWDKRKARTIRILKSENE